MRSAFINKANQDEKQKQQLITSKTVLFKKIVNKVKIASDKTGTKQIILHSAKNNMGPLYNKAQ